MRIRILAIVAAMNMGCQGSPPADSDSVASRIIGGEPATADPAVLALVATSATCDADSAPDQVFCSATLVAPRAVLTAAHCVAQASVTTLRIDAGNDAGREPTTSLRVAWVRPHPQWKDRAHDIALIALEEPAPLTPLPLLERLDGSHVGAKVRMVGFGEDEQRHVGIKRQGMAQITAIEAETFSSIASPAMSCNGDSGGPVLLSTFGVEHVAGVTSGGGVSCRSSIDTRVDVNLDAFLRQGLLDIERSPGPRAPLDSAVDYCAEGCTTDGDCPSGMTCTAGSNGRKSCALDGFAPGRFGDVCAESSECAGGICALSAGCRCYHDCDSRTRDDSEIREGGCSMSGHTTGGSWTPWFILLTMLFAGACRGNQSNRGNCPEGAHPFGQEGVETGCVKDGEAVRHGPYVEWWPDGGPRKRSGAYVNGALEGKWSTWYASGKPEREVEYRDGKLHGHGVSWYENEQKHDEGELRDGLRVGSWSFWHEKGNKERDLEYLQDTNEQRWTVYSESGSKVQSGVFLNGQKTGRFVEYHANGQKAAEGEYVKSRKHGPWVEYDPQGKPTKVEQWNEGGH